MVFKDPWLMCPLSFKPITSPPHQFMNIWVSDLRMTSGEWNWEMIKMVLWEIEHDELRRFPIHAMKENDKTHLSL